MEFDFRRADGTTTFTHAPHLSPKVAWDTTSTRNQVGVPGPCAFTSSGSPGGHLERNQVHTVSLPKMKEQFSLSVQPETRYGDLKTRRPVGAVAGGNFHSGLHSTASASSCLAAKMRSRWRCSAQERLWTLARRSARPRSCASTPSRSRFKGRGGRRNRLRVRLRSRHPGAGARRRSSHGDGGCRGLGREVGKKARLDTPRDRGARVCCRASVSASTRPRPRPRLFFGALSLFQMFVSLQKSRQGILAFSF